MKIKRKFSDGKEESIEFSEDAMFSIFSKAKKYDNLLKHTKFSALSCSFCGKNQEIVEKLVAGPQVYICNECVELCTEIIAGEALPKAIEATEQPSVAVAEGEVYGNDCPNGQCS